jgi:hypothetical protein
MDVAFSVLASLELIGRGFGSNEGGLPTMRILGIEDYLQRGISYKSLKCYASCGAYLQSVLILGIARTGDTLLLIS